MGAELVGGGFVVGQDRAAVHPIGAEQGGDQPPVGVDLIGERDHTTQLPTRVAERNRPRLQVAASCHGGGEPSRAHGQRDLPAAGVPRQFVANHPQERWTAQQLRVGRRALGAYGGRVSVMRHLPEPASCIGGAAGWTSACHRSTHDSSWAAGSAWE